MSLRAHAVWALAALAALSMAALDGYTLKRAFKVGDVRKYSVAGKFDFNGTDIDFTATATEKVVAVADDGGYSIEEKQTDSKINGQEAPGSGSETPTVTSYKSTGEIIEIKSDHVEPNTYRFANLAVFLLPGKEVKAGDTWTADIKADSKTGAVDAKASYTLVGEDKAGGKDALKVKYTIKESGDAGASSDGTMWVDKADNSLIKLTTKWVNAPVPGVPAPLSGDVTLTLIP